jgi:hypothetical protein
MSEGLDWRTAVRGLIGSSVILLLGVGLMAGGGPVATRPATTRAASGPSVGEAFFTLKNGLARRLCA